MTAADVSLRSGARLAAHSVAVDASIELLDTHTPDSFVWLDGDHGFVTSGVAAVVAPADAAAFLAAIDHSVSGTHLSASAGPRAVGALAFAADLTQALDAGELVVPSVIVGRDRDGRAWRTAITNPDADPDADAAPAVVGRADDAEPRRFDVTAATTKAQWRAMVEAALADIGRNRLEKVVLARAVHVDADRPFDLREVLAHLRRAQPGCIVYADGTFLGASPELLVRKAGVQVASRPLAGTGVDTAALVRSAKDAHEHGLVTEAVVRALRDFCSDVRADGPAPLQLADVTHLATTVTGRVDDARISVVDLVAALHPTPAVAGTPRAIALALIDALEPTPRGRYAGPCGWVDRNGDGEFVVALRGGEIDGNRALIHAGAGIVSASDPDAEWAETQQKLTPMLQALVRP